MQENGKSSNLHSLTFTVFPIMDQLIVCQSKKRERENLFQELNVHLIFGT